MTVEPYLAIHVTEMLGREPPQAQMCEELSRSAFTVRVDGKPIICGGVMEITPHKGVVWSFVGPEAPPKSLHAAASRFISTLAYRRLEATCLTGFERGAKWLRRLGFDYEGTMRRWGADGSDYDLYSRVTHE